MPATMFLLLGALLIFAALALALSVLGVLTSEKRAVGRSLEAIEAINRAPEVLRKELERPFSERVIAPLGERLVGLGRRLSRADTAANLQHKLDIAGNPSGWDVNRMLGVKVLGALVLGGLTLLYLLGKQPPLGVAVVALAGLTIFGFVLPNVLLHNAGQKRTEQMQRALPDALDLMTISVEAGLGFDAAVSRVARDTTGPLAEEFSRTLQEMQIGVSRLEAMRAMAERTPMKDLKSFCLAMVQADSFGIPIARVLRVQAREMRVKRRQRAEEKAQQLPVKILFPLVFFILPCLFIIILGPVVLSMIAFFGTR